MGETILPQSKSRGWLSVLVWTIGIQLFLLWCQPVEPSVNGVAIAPVWGMLLTTAIAGFVTVYAIRENSIRLPKTLLSPQLLILLLPVVVLAASWSSLGVTQHQMRLMINLSWNWVAIALLLLMLQIHGELNQSLKRKLPIALLWFATALSGVGLYQHYVFYPQMSQQFTELTTQQAKFQQQIETSRGITRQRSVEQLQMVEQQMQQMGLPLDPEQQKLLRQRVVDSTEPFGFFGLANTFAGVLMLSVLIGLMQLLTEWKSQPQRIVLMIMLAFQLWVLLLTKSRSAWLGLLCGLFLMSLCWLKMQSGAKSKLAVRGLLGGIAGLIVVGGLLLVTGSLDVQVLLESNKSLQYRFEYWQGTWAMLQDYCWTGVGLGQFRRHYLQYKVPQSSEEILDPHNWLLELWSMGGILAFLLGIAIVVFLVWGFTKLLLKSTSHQNVQWLPCASLFPASATWGGIACLVLFFGQLFTANGWDDQLLLSGIGLLLVYGLAKMMISPSQESKQASETPTAGWSILGFSMLVHLSAAGGAGMPGMMQWVLLLLWWALERPSPERELGSEPAEENRVTNRVYWASVTISLGALCLSVAFYLTTWRPVISSVDFRDPETSQKLISLDRPQNLSIDRVTQDVYDPEPIRFLARLLDSPKWNRSVDAMTHKIKLLYEAELRDPRNAGLHKQIVQDMIELESQKASLSHSSAWDEQIQFVAKTEKNEGHVDEQTLAQAAESLMTQAIALYPTDPESHLQYGLLLLEIGENPKLGLAKIAEAIRLEAILEQAGHPDQQLPEEMLAKIAPLLTEIPGEIEVTEAIRQRIQK